MHKNSKEFIGSVPRKETEHGGNLNSLIAKL